MIINIIETYCHYYHHYFRSLRFHSRLIYLDILLVMSEPRRLLSRTLCRFGESFVLMRNLSDDLFTCLAVLSCGVCVWEFLFTFAVDLERSEGISSHVYQLVVRNYYIRSDGLQDVRSRLVYNILTSVCHLQY